MCACTPTHMWKHIQRNKLYSKCVWASTYIHGIITKTKIGLLFIKHIYDFQKYFYSCVYVWISLCVHVYVGKIFDI